MPKSRKQLLQKGGWTREATTKKKKGEKNKQAQKVWRTAKKNTCCHAGILGKKKAKVKNLFRGGKKENTKRHEWTETGHARTGGKYPGKMGQHEGLGNDGSTI